MRMLPALPGPVLLAEILDPLFNVTDCPAVIVMSPPCACVAVLLAVMSPPLLSWT